MTTKEEKISNEEQANKKYLVVAQAYAGSGKSELSDYMRDKLGFKVLSVENYLREKFGKDWFSYLKDIDVDRVWKEQVYDKIGESLRQYKGVFVDTTRATSKKPDTKEVIDRIYSSVPAEIEAEKYLARIIVSDEERFGRILKRENNDPARNKIILEQVRKGYGGSDWKNVYNTSEDVKILVLKNETRDDLEKIKKKLKRAFVKYVKKYMQNEVMYNV